MDFSPEFNLNGKQLEVVEEMKILGLTIRSDLSWKSNTEQMVSKAYKRLWVLRRLKGMGANLSELKDVYIKQVRSLLELAAPAWHGSLTKEEQHTIERVQKSAHHIMLGGKYLSYKSALELTGLQTLEARREKLCLKFAKKAASHPKHKNWFIPLKKSANTRQKPAKYCEVVANTVRYHKSPISYLTRLLNSDN